MSEKMYIQTTVYGLNYTYIRKLVFTVKKFFTN